MSAGPTNARRWLALTVPAGSQLLIVLDATIVNVALTAIRADLELFVAVALAGLTRIDPHNSYLGTLLPATVGSQQPCSTRAAA